MPVYHGGKLLEFKTSVKNTFKNNFILMTIFPRNYTRSWFYQANLLAEFLTNRCEIKFKYRISSDSRKQNPACVRTAGYFLVLSPTVSKV